MYYIFSKLRANLAVCTGVIGRHDTCTDSAAFGQADVLIFIKPIKLRSV
jgi:hypothetical protein